MLRHQPVMAKETLASMPVDRKVYVDGTFGHGGHVEYILQNGEFKVPNSKLNKEEGLTGSQQLAASDDVGPMTYDPSVKIIAIDRDEKMLEKGKALVEKYHANIVFVRDSYKNIDEILKKEGIAGVDYILLDLGVNMEHFKDPERGFSFLYDAPLDMRFDQSSGQSAADVVNTYSREKLAAMFTTYGDFAPTSGLYMADAIIEKRAEKKIETTHELNDTLRNKGIRKEQMAVVFQCLRIETNHELDELITFIEKFPATLNIGGRCAIMTYHSIEDRIVKLAFKKIIDDNPSFVLYNKKVIAPHYLEVKSNRAARSAKFRIIERVA